VCRVVAWEREHVAGGAPAVDTGGRMGDRERLGGQGGSAESGGGGG